MPIISRIGTRSWKVRGLYFSIFLALTLGGVTMVYPFMLMVAGSFSSQVDAEGLGIYPAFWFDDDILYRKYVESRYSTILRTEQTHGIEYRSWKRLFSVDHLTGKDEVENQDPKSANAAEASSRQRISQVSALDPKWVEAYLQYRGQADWPTPWYHIAQGQADRFVRKHARRFRQQMAERFDNSLAALNDYYRIGYVDWGMVQLPGNEQLHSRRFRTGLALDEHDLLYAMREFKAAVPHMDRVPVNVDGLFWYTFLRTLYPSSENDALRTNAYNKSHGTDFQNYRQVVLTARPPAEGKAREDWETFVREELNLNFLRIDASVVPAYRRFLNQPEQYASIAEYNQVHGTQLSSFDDIHIAVHVPPGSKKSWLKIPDKRRLQEDLSVFVVNRDACPLEAISVYGPRQDFLAWLEKEGSIAQFSNAHTLPLPLAEADYADLLANTSEIRWEETQRNYLHVLEFILVRGRAVSNTIIYCGLLIAATLLVNPLAAYALSRYRPPSQYKVLLICMATMAFPGEVTMIPAFLMLKKFPFWNLVVGCSVSATILYLGIRFRPKMSEMVLGLSSLTAGILAGWWLSPYVAALFGREVTHISLLNTFAALVLPSMANGYGLFLLKGFFDSLPRELYESADIDGASEWTKFWSLTMNLSKPILAVLALGAFTAAYSEFMMALIIIPDRSMWTLMVWVFQLQISAAQPVVLTSVLLTAIPTFVVFIFCQNIIIRGIVVPVEK